MDAVVRRINNRACVLVSIGDFPKANRLFTLAMLKHKGAADVGSCGYYGNASVGSGLDHDNFDASMSGPDRRNNKNTPNVNERMNNLDSDSSSSEDGSDSFYNEDEDEESDDDDDSTDPFFDSSANYGNYHYHYPQRKAATMPPIVPISRMSTSSQVHTFPYHGQRHQDQEQEQPRYHQVYSLPIVMNVIEWEQASREDLSFVLIFNSAMCNHLWGMGLLRSQQQEKQQQQQQGNLPLHYRSYQDQDKTTSIPAQELLQRAKLLYRFALQKSSHKGITGVGKLCHPAIFNNVSHICKTLEGYSSSEAYYYDKLLLKAVFLLIDLSSSSSSSNSNSNSTTVVDLSASASASVPSMSLQQHHEEDESDADIIDAFLENVFYLVAVPECIAPAPAA